MISIFNGNYNEVGDINNNLLLKTLGKIKILQGKKFIDLLDDNGNINNSFKVLKVSSVDKIGKDGFYLVGDDIYLKAFGKIFQISLGSESLKTIKEILKKLDELNENLANVQEKVNRGEINIADINGSLNINGILSALQGLFKKVVTNDLVVNGLLSAAKAYIRDLSSENITTSYLTVTKAAHFFELIIDKIKAAGGAVLFTPADGFKIDKVEQVTLQFLMSDDKVVASGGTTVTVPGYRLYWKATDDGKAIHNMWLVNDQAICLNFNLAKEGINRNVTSKYYWCLVTKVSDKPELVDYNNGSGEPEVIESHYIEIPGENFGNFSLVDKNTRFADLTEYTVNPEVGDEIAMLGCRSEDILRQSAVYIAAYKSIDGELNAPLFVQYRHIDDFDLDSHKYTWFSAGPTAKGDENKIPANKIQGDIVLSGGKSIEDLIEEIKSNTFLAWTTETSLATLNTSENPNLIDKTFISGKDYTFLGVATTNLDTDESLVPKDYTWTPYKGSFKSIAFTRTNDDISRERPTGGTYANPIPDSTIYLVNKTVTWSDGIPQGENKIWATSCIFKGDGTKEDWTYPSPMSDTASYDVEFSPWPLSDESILRLRNYWPNSGNTSNGNYNPSRNVLLYNNYQYDKDHPEQQPYIWFDPTLDLDQSINPALMNFRAERYKLNGEWGDWVIVRIVGEQGEDGNSYRLIPRSELIIAEYNPISNFSQAIKSGIDLATIPEDWKYGITYYKKLVCAVLYEIWHIVGKEIHQLKKSDCEVTCISDTNLSLASDWNETNDVITFYFDSLLHTTEILLEDPKLSLFYGSDVSNEIIDRSLITNSIKKYDELYNSSYFTVELKLKNTSGQLVDQVVERRQIDVLMPPKGIWSVANDILGVVYDATNKATFLMHPDRIKMEIVNDLKTTGITLDGNNSNIDLQADKVTFSYIDEATGVKKYDKISIDPQTGTLNAVDGNFEGTVKANLFYRNVYCPIFLPITTALNLGSLYLAGYYKNKEFIKNESTSVNRFNIPTDASVVDVVSIINSSDRILPSLVSDYGYGELSLPLASQSEGCLILINGSLTSSFLNSAINSYVNIAVKLMTPSSGNLFVRYANGDALSHAIAGYTFIRPGVSYNLYCDGVNWWITSMGGINTFGKQGNILYLDTDARRYAVDITSEDGGGSSSLTPYPQNGSLNVETLSGTLTFTKGWLTGFRRHDNHIHLSFNVATMEISGKLSNNYYNAVRCFASLSNDNPPYYLLSWDLSSNLLWASVSPSNKICEPYGQDTKPEDSFRVSTSANTTDQPRTAVITLTTKYPSGRRIMNASSGDTIALSTTFTITQKAVYTISSATEGVTIVGGNPKVDSGENITIVMQAPSGKYIEEIDTDYEITTATVTADEPDYIAGTLTVYVSNITGNVSIHVVLLEESYTIALSDFYLDYTKNSYDTKTLSVSKNGTTIANLDSTKLYIGALDSDYFLLNRNGNSITITAVQDNLTDSIIEQYFSIQYATSEIKYVKVVLYIWPKVTIIILTDPESGFRFPNEDTSIQVFKNRSLEDTEAITVSTINLYYFPVNSARFTVDNYGGGVYTMPSNTNTQASIKIYNISLDSILTCSNIIHSFNINYSNLTNCDKSSDSPTTVNVGSNVTITLIPNSGYFFRSSGVISITGSYLNISSTLNSYGNIVATITNVLSNLTISATAVLYNYGFVVDDAVSISWNDTGTKYIYINTYRDSDDVDSDWEDDTNTINVVRGTNSSGQFISFNINNLAYDGEYLYLPISASSTTVGARLEKLIVSYSKVSYTREVTITQTGSPLITVSTGTGIMFEGGDTTINTSANLYTGIEIVPADNTKYFNGSVSDFTISPSSKGTFSNLNYDKTMFTADIIATSDVTINYSGGFVDIPRINGITVVVTGRTNKNNSNLVISSINYLDQIIKSSFTYDIYYTYSNGDTSLAVSNLTSDTYTWWSGENDTWSSQTIYHTERNIVISYNNYSYNISSVQWSLTQGPKPDEYSISVSGNTTNLAWNENSAIWVTISIIKNESIEMDDWSNVSISRGTYSFITLSSSTPSGSSYYFNINNNTVTSSRTGYITFSYRGLSYVKTVTLLAAPSYTLTIPYSSNFRIDDSGTLYTSWTFLPLESQSIKFVPINGYSFSSNSLLSLTGSGHSTRLDSSDYSSYMWYDIELVSDASASISNMTIPVTITGIYVDITDKYYKYNNTINAWLPASGGYVTPYITYTWGYNYSDGTSVQQDINQTAYSTNLYIESNSGSNTIKYINASFNIVKGNYSKTVTANNISVYLNGVAQVPTYRYVRCVTYAVEKDLVRAAVVNTGKRVQVGQSEYTDLYAILLVIPDLNSPVKLQSTITVTYNIYAIYSNTGTLTLLSGTRSISPTSTVTITDDLGITNTYYGIQIGGGPYLSSISVSNSSIT